MSFALLFPGQGSQAIGMLAEYANRYKAFKATFEQASQVLSQDLFKLVSEGPEEELNLTVNTQPVMLAASVGVWRVWSSLNEQVPDFMCGHSLGEYSALTCAGAFEFEDAIRVVRKRAELMQAAVPAPTGGMAVIIGLEAGRVIELCAEVDDGGVVEAVNFNAPTQIVVAGHSKAVASVIKSAKDSGARRCVELPISVPAHSSLLENAAQEFAKLLSSVRLQEPTVPVVHNTNVMVSKNVDEIRQALAVQMHTPVRWLEIINYLSGAGVSHFIEVGPGRVLKGLNRGIDKKLNTLTTDTPESMENVAGVMNK